MKENPCKWHEVPIKGCVSCCGKNSYYYIDEATPDELLEQQYRDIILNLRNTVESIDESSFTVSDNISGECDFTYGPKTQEEFVVWWNKYQLEKLDKLDWGLLK